MILRPAAVAALTLALAGGAVVAAPAQAATECRPTSLQPPFFVVGHKPQPVTFDVRSQLVEVPDPTPAPTPEPAPPAAPTVPAAEGGVARVTAVTEAPRRSKKFDEGLAKLRAAAKKARAEGGARAQSGCLGASWGIIEEEGYWVVDGLSGDTVEFLPERMDNAHAGAHTVFIFDLAQEGEPLVGQARQDVRRYTTWGGSFDASEPVRVNTNVRLTGKLSRVNWPKGNYTSYTGRPVEVQFQPVGGHFSTVARTTTGKGGVATVNVKATRDGAWRFFYPGAVVASRAYSVPDYVDTTPK